MKSSLLLAACAVALASSAFAQGIDRRPHPNGGIYGWITPPPTPPPQPINQDQYHAGWGGSYQTPEQRRVSAANSAWSTMTYIRGRMSVGTSFPARFNGGNDSFMATIAWELSRSSMQSAFRNAWGRSDRAITLRFPYNGNDVQMVILGSELPALVSALQDAVNGRNPTGYTFHEPPHVPPQIGAPRTAPLMVRLFGPQNGTETGMVWTLLSMMNTVNPNRNLSPHSGWIGPQPQRSSSLAPTPNGTSVTAVTDGMGSGGINVGLGATTIASGGPATPPAPAANTAIGAGMLRL